MNAEQIKSLFEENFSESGFFIIGLKASDTSDFELVVDGDDGVSIGDCSKIARALKSVLEESLEDYSLNVSSPGASAPLVLKRQYPKHVGRDLKVTLHGSLAETGKSTLEGNLTEVGEDDIVLEWQTKERIEGRKAKQKVDHQKRIKFEEIKESKVQLSFK